jgi:hypothetical protein
MKYSALNPCGLRQTMERFPLSPRLSSLDGKVVYCVEIFGKPVFMKEVAKRLPKYAPGVKAVFKEKIGGFEKFFDVNEIAQKADAMIGGTVMGGGTGMYGAYWVMDVEKRGVPSVYVVGDIYTDGVSVAAARRGMPNLRTTVISLVEEDRITQDITDEQFEKICLNMIEALTKPLTAEEKKADKIVSKKRPRIAITGTLAEIQNYFFEQRWTDGLPIIPPTEELVKEFLKHTSHSPDEVVTTTMWPEELTVTVEKVAIIGVMAGCKPEYMPVLLAMVEAFGDSSFGIFLPSDSSPSLMTIVNGPIRNEIGMNAGRNALGPCNQANASIGRFLTLSVISLGGSWPGINDYSVQGNPTKYSFCFPENEEKSPWEPFHVSMGHKPNESVVSIFIGFASHGNATVLWQPIKVVLDNVAKGRTGSMLLLTPDMARLCVADGMSKEDIEQYIWEHASAPAPEFQRKSTQTAEGRRPDLPVYQREAVKVIVVGGPSGLASGQSWQYRHPSSTASVDKWR